MLGRTNGIEEISPEESLKHTGVFRLTFGRTVRNVQDRVAAAGVNDLGGTLVEESISRMAGAKDSSRLDPPELIAAATARPAGR